MLAVSGRRGRGEGHVSSYETKGGTRWRIVWGEVDPDTGRRARQRSRGGFATEREASRQLRRVLTSIDAGTYASPSHVTLERYVAEWLDGLRLSPSTVAGYRKLARLHVVPYLGERRLDSIRAATLAKLYRDLEEDGWKGRGRQAGVKMGLGVNTVRKVHTLLGEILQAAVDEHAIASNPARSKVANPPTAKQVRDARPEMTPWTAGELSAFLAWGEAHGSALAPAWVVAARTGIRRGELLALRWGDIDLRAGTLAVRRAVVLVKEPKPQHLVLKGTKNGRPRVIDLDDATVSALRAWRSKIMLVDVARGARGAYVFGRIDSGALRNPEHVSGVFRADVRAARAALGEAAVQPIHLHDLRHTHATLMLEAGVQPKVVQERLGHETISITMDLYSHVMPTVQKAAVAVFASLLG